MTTLDAALLDVRKAYRLLADYQQRLFELMGLIRERLGASDYYHSYAQSLPQALAGMDKRDKSGLRFLPLFDASFIWLKHQGQPEPWAKPLPGDVMFGAWVRSDTGFDKHTSCFGDLPAEETSSEVVLSAVVCRDAPAGKFNWYDHAWCGIDYPEDGHVNDTDLPGFACYTKAAPLAAFADAASIEHTLGAWCAEAGTKLGIPLALASR